MKSKVTIESTKIAYNVKVDVIYRDGRYLVNCPELRTFGRESDNEQQALNSFEKAVKIFFKFNLKHKSTERSLEMLLWKKRGDSTYVGVIPSKIKTRFFGGSVEI